MGDIDNSIMHLVSMRCERISRRLLLFVSFVLFNSVGIFCQYHGDKEVKELTSQIGERHGSSKTRIMANVLKFDNSVFRFYIDSVKSTITVHLRGKTKNDKYFKSKGSIILYDLSDKRIIWDKSVNYSKSIIEHFNNTIIETKAKKSVCVDMETGLNLWRVRNKLFFVFPWRNVGLGYKTKALSENLLDLEGINLKTGDQLWSRKIDREFGWSGLNILNDSTLLVSASGLYTVDVNTGKGWDFKQKTGAKKTNFWLGYVSYFHVSSNALVDSLHIYYASRDVITKLDKAGNELWSANLPKERVSQSRLLSLGDTLIMVNLGAVRQGYSKKNMGTPFIAAFSKSSGEEIYIESLGEKKNPILDFSIDSGEIIFSFENGLSVHSIRNGKIKGLKMKFEKKIFKNAGTIFGNSLYLRYKDDVPVNLKLSYPNRIYILDEDDFVVGLNEELKIVSKNKWTSLYKRKNYGDGYYAVINDRQAFLFKDDEFMAELKLGLRSFILYNKLYDDYEDSIEEIDLNQFSKN